ncbi:lycopene cyclase domain-containing protein [Archangium sp.]|jgi:hypothetical protein|uniref:lycopene cyclase domain-containing protein n=1 Tax=Archangium sp. TaxID=1872627 RepID=UPI002ED80817
MTHDYLVLALLFLVPGALIWFLRPDLRGLMRGAALMALPFATTEWLFYPEYWAPKFLFDLADRIGFGIEDVLLVVGLAAFASTAHAVAFRRTVVSLGPSSRPWRRVVGAFVAVLAVAVLLLGVGVPILYASVVAMVSLTGAVLVVRQDLVVPSLLGSGVTVVIYFGLCLGFEALMPGEAVERIWKPSLFLEGRLLGVPLDELLYGLGAGFASTAFPAWAFGLRFVPLPPRSAE